ncbi:hypothetical protein DL766_006310 [Monosporascus sp. MC13-8B]|uniref:SnoaL-like domain-containing protein n=1 Tax=Monosporascus cannonballus TaxID=155416 RepID=A0ABY0GUM6_9PEZI|nr:hypothetical protein DL762_008987 [Monosporascus cannonballus]RYO98517.1 hypothetical protein DL763_002169 [Monosporascus cannonballus]RYP27584.1 hypothetical protein DL766_006310 [Monosporascus sp. MC13-8B]
MASPNPIDYFAIKNTLSLYCIALDTKDFRLLEQVFAEDVDAKYPFAAMKGVRDVADAIQKRLAPIASQHALTTQTISIAADGKTAEAVTYFTGIHFGQGKWKGKEVTAWGRYVDTLVLFEGKGSLPGASGRWLISRREVVFMGCLGEERVMEGE